MTTFTDVFGGDTVPPSDYSYVRHTIAANEQLVWPSQFDGSGLLIADILELDVTVAGCVVTLPQASSVSVGVDVLVRNIGAESVDIVDFASGAVTTIAAGVSKFVYVTDNSTEAGVWSVFTFGTGTSSADAAALAGYGLRAWMGQLITDHQYIEKNASYTVVESDRGKLINIVAGSVTMDLPQASVAEAGFFVMFRNNSAGTVTIDGFDAELVDNGLTLQLMPGESTILVCSGSGWFSVGLGKDVDFTFSEFIVNAAAGSVALSANDVSGRMIGVDGVAAGNITITLPAVDNIYFARTGTGLGAFSATFTTGSGLTVVLPANQRTVLYCDGTNILTALTTSVTTSLSLGDGSAFVPSIGFALDTDTGIYRVGSGAIGFATNAITPVQINAANGLLGKVTANQPLVVQPASGSGIVDARLASSTDGANNEQLLLRISPTNFAALLATKVGTGTFVPMAFFTSDLERMRILANGRFLVNKTADDGANQLQVAGTGAFTDTSAGAVLDQLVVTNSSLAVNTEAGVFFAPTSAGGVIRGARISGVQENGTDAVGLKFYTGVGASITEKMRIVSDGNIVFGGGSSWIGAAGAFIATFKGASNRSEFSMQSGAADANGANLGFIHFDAQSNSVENRVASIGGSIDGTTALSRGGALSFSTRQDNIATLAERVRITNSGRMLVNVPVGGGLDSGSPNARIVASNSTVGVPEAGGTIDTFTSYSFGMSSVRLDVGVSAPGDVWIQPRSIANLATNYSLALTPNGGSVLVGPISALNSDKLQVDGRILTTNAAINYNGKISVGGPQAFAVFNGTGTPALTSSFNVSSITDGGVGIYTLNYTTAISGAGIPFGMQPSATFSAGINFPSFNTTSCTINVRNSAGALVDVADVRVVVEA